MGAAPQVSTSPAVSRAACSAAASGCAVPLYTWSNTDAPRCARAPAPCATFCATANVRAATAWALSASAGHAGETSDATTAATDSSRSPAFPARARALLGKQLEAPAQRAAVGLERAFELGGRAGLLAVDRQCAAAHGGD